jgi:hypothetical protein
MNGLGITYNGGPSARPGLSEKNAIDPSSRWRDVTPFSWSVNRKVASAGGSARTMRSFSASGVTSYSSRAPGKTPS